MKNAVIMSRVSSDEQAKGYSLDVQLEQLSNHCKRNNINIIKHYKEDHSAKDFNRPEFQKFLVYANKNKQNIDLLLITSWDRFSRNITDALVMLRRLENLGIQVQAIEQPIDMSIPENKAMLALFLAIPEIDNDRRSIKIKGGMRGALKAGRWCRSAPIGYRNARDHENKPIIIPNEKAKYIQFIYKEMAKNTSQTVIRAKLKNKGVNIPKNTICNILKNPVYMGKIKVPEFGDEKEVLIEGKHEGIVSDKLFYKVQGILELNKRKRNITNYKTQREELPLRGILYCSKCNGKMTGSKSKSKNGSYYHYYHCNHCYNERHPAYKVNSTLETILNDFKFTKSSKTLYKEFVKSILSASEKEDEKELKKAKVELQKIKKRISKLQDLLVDGKIEHDHYQNTMIRYAEIKQELELKIGDRDVKDAEFKNWLKMGFDELTIIKKLYDNSAVTQKQDILSSIFPEKLQFDGKKCRTPRINDTLRYILQIDKDLQGNKKGQFSKKLHLSHKVEPEGFEPSSKRGTIQVSTCLFCD